MRECTIELTIRVTKVINTSDEPAKATVEADKAVRQIISKLDSCDQVQIIADKRFPDVMGE